MFSSFGQFSSTAQFFLYGRSNFTRTAWEKAYRSYEKPDILDDYNRSLKGKVFMVTGANSGIGKEIATFFAKRGGMVYMVCRSRQRGEAARNEILKECDDSKEAESRVCIIIGDCSLEADMRDAWELFMNAEKERTPSKPPRLDGLICNAGALLNEKTLTSEGVEVTFGAQLLFGVYLLGKLALESGVMPNTRHSRLIVVSSGGIYNTKFPQWDIATSESETVAYDGQFVFAYAKRGQVLLCERWAEQYPAVKIVSVHPGWVQTPGIEKSYGESKSNFEPLRTAWQGAEGIMWLAVCPWEKIESGAFYLDRKPQPKHIGGLFFSQGSFTKNSSTEVDEMMAKLEKWSSKETRDSGKQGISKKVPLSAKPDLFLDLSKISGRWYVLANIPTSVEVGAINCIETYRYLEQEKVVRAIFEYQPTDSKTSTSLEMRGRVTNPPQQTHWNMDPKVMGFHVPLALDLLFLDIPEDYSYCIACSPDRTALWILTRETPSQFPSAGFSIEEVYRLKIENDEEAFPVATRVTQYTPAADIAAGGMVPEKLILEREFLKSKILPRLDEYGFDISKVLRCGWTLWN